MYFISHKLISNCSMSYGWKHTKCVVKEMTIFKLNLFSDQYDICLSLLINLHFQNFVRSSLKRVLLCNLSFLLIHSDIKLSLCSLVFFFESFNKPLFNCNQRLVFRTCKCEHKLWLFLLESYTRWWLGTMPKI